MKDVPYVAAIVATGSKNGRHGDPNVRYQPVARADGELEDSESGDSEPQQHLLEDHWTAAALVDHLKTFQTTRKTQISTMVAILIGMLLFVWWAVT
jgi:hypothetical protein